MTSIENLILSNNKKRVNQVSHQIGQFEIDDPIEKGRILPVGTIKKRGANNYIKTASGWKYHSRANVTGRTKPSNKEDLTSTQLKKYLNESMFKLDSTTKNLWNEFFDTGDVKSIRQSDDENLRVASLRWSGYKSDQYKQLVIKLKSPKGVSSENGHIKLPNDIADKLLQWDANRIASIDKVQKPPTLKEVLANPKSKKIVESIEERLSDLRSNPGRKEHIEDVMADVKRLKDEFGYDYDTSSLDELREKKVKVDMGSLKRGTVVKLSTASRNEAIKLRKTDKWYNHAIAAFAAYPKGYEFTVDGYNGSNLRVKDKNGEVRDVNMDRFEVVESSSSKKNSFNKLLRQSKLSSAEYQKAKKLTGFSKDGYKWSSDESLYIKKSIEDQLNDDFAILEGDVIEKARSGKYADNATNKKLNRVGQEYGNKKKEEVKDDKSKKTDDKKSNSQGELGSHEIAQLTHLKKIVEDNPQKAYEIYSALSPEAQKVVPQEIANKLVEQSHADPQDNSVDYETLGVNDKKDIDDHSSNENVSVGDTVSVEGEKMNVVKVSEDGLRLQLKDSKGNTRKEHIDDVDVGESNEFGESVKSYIVEAYEEHKNKKSLIEALKADDEMRPFKTKEIEKLVDEVYNDATAQIQNMSRKELYAHMESVYGIEGPIDEFEYDDMRKELTQEDIESIVEAEKEDSFSKVKESVVEMLQSNRRMAMSPDSHKKNFIEGNVRASGGSAEDAERVFKELKDSGEFDKLKEEHAGKLTKDELESANFFKKNPDQVDNIKRWKDKLVKEGVNESVVDEVLGTENKKNLSKSMESDFELLGV